jgi:hypothetical protein
MEYDPKKTDKKIIETLSVKNAEIIKNNELYFIKIIIFIPKYY